VEAAEAVEGLESAPERCAWTLRISLRRNRGGRVSNPPTKRPPGIPAFDNPALSQGCRKARTTICDRDDAAATGLSEALGHDDHGSRVDHTHLIFLKRIYS
jgi:hypothetical protein